MTVVPASSVDIESVGTGALAAPALLARPFRRASLTFFFAREEAAELLKSVSPPISCTLAVGGSTGGSAAETSVTLFLAAPVGRTVVELWRRSVAVAAGFLRPRFDVFARELEPVLLALCCAAADTLAAVLLAAVSTAVGAVSGSVSTASAAEAPLRDDMEEDLGTC